MTSKELSQKKKDYLYSYRPLENRIRKLQEDISRLKIEADGAKAIQYSDMPKGSVKLQSPQETYVTLLESTIERLWEIKTECIRKKEEIRQTIHTIGDSDMESLLEYKYLERMKIKQISEMMGYERTQIYRIHDKALERLEIPFDYKK